MSTTLRIGGRYAVIRQLGEGGMGSVWEVERDDGRRFAMKRIVPRFLDHQEAHERFAREVRIAAAVKHSNIVEVIDWGVDATTGPYYVMEILRGVDLERHVTKTGRIARTEAQRILGEVSDALSCIHQNGVVHRDLKPANVFLEGDGRKVKLLDFGIAKQTTDRASSAPSGSVIGSLAWMAPEQLEQGVIDPRTDVWAFGLLAFYTLTGKCFWTTDDSLRPSLIREICLTPIPLASARAEQVSAAHLLPAGFDAWFSRCVARIPSDRFSDVRTTFEELSRMAKIRLVHPTPTPPSSAPTDPEEQALAAAIAYLQERVLHAIDRMEASATHHGTVTPPPPVVSVPVSPPHPTPTPPPVPSVPRAQPSPGIYQARPHPSARAPAPPPFHLSGPIVPVVPQLPAPPKKEPSLVGPILAVLVVAFWFILAITALYAIAREPAEEPAAPSGPTAQLRSGARCNIAPAPPPENLA